MLLPQHHKARLAVPVGDEPARGTPEGSAFRFMPVTAVRTGATGATFPDEARGDTGFPGLVQQVLLDTASLHLRNLLPDFAGQPLFFLRVPLHTGRIADNQLPNAVVSTPGDGLASGLVQEVPHLGVGLAYEPSLGADQPLPPPAPPHWLWPGEPGE